MPNESESIVIDKLNSDGRESMANRRGLAKGNLWPIDEPGLMKGSVSPIDELEPGLTKGSLSPIDELKPGLQGSIWLIDELKLGRAMEFMLHRRARLKKCIAHRRDEGSAILSSIG